MYRSIHVRNFRSFTDLRLDGLTRINLIGGKNNIGKTALLEALLLLNGVSPSETVMNFRRIERIEGSGMTRARLLPFERLSVEELGEEVGLFFHQADLRSAVEITGQRVEAADQFLRITAFEDLADKNIREEIREALNRSLRFWPEDSLEQPIDRIFLLDYQEGERKHRSFVIIGKVSVISEGWAAPFPISYRGARVLFLTSKVIGDFGNLVKAGEEAVVFRFLEVVEPGLERLVTLFDEQSGPMLYGVLRDPPHRLPLHVMGDGMIRLADLAIRLGNARNGLLLVDELENGLHWSTLPKVWQALKESARTLKVQVFATTHSYECIRAAYEAFKEDESYDFCFYRIERTEQGIRAVAYDRETLGVALEEGLEVR